MFHIYTILSFLLKKCSLKVIFIKRSHGDISLINKKFIVGVKGLVLL